MNSESLKIKYHINFGNATPEILLRVDIHFEIFSFCTWNEKDVPLYKKFRRRLELFGTGLPSGAHCKRDYYVPSHLYSAH